MRQRDRTGDALQTFEGMIGSCGTTREDIVAVLTRHNDAITAVVRLARFAEVPLEICEACRHAQDVPSLLANRLLT